MGRHGFKDWVGLVETAYVLDESIEGWMGLIADKVEPILDVGLGVGVALARISPPNLSLEHLTVRGGSRELEESVRAFVASIPWPDFERMLNHRSPARTLSEVVYPVDPSQAQGVRQAFHAQDMLVVVCNSSAEGFLTVSLPLPERRGLASRERLRLNRLAAHVGSGLRLRSRLSALDLDEGERAEAIFKPDGKVLDARGPATPKSARERLRYAVVHSERARGPLRRQDPSRALSLWEALVEGRWSLVDHFDSDGSRMVVAVENEPGVRDPRGLTPMQFRIAEALGQGRSAKEIGYCFGITVSAVNNAIAEIKHKLGLRSRTEVATFFAPGGVRARLATLEISEDSLLVGDYGGCDRDALTALTEAEQAVALLLLQGATNQAIAQRRRSSYNTVANQLKSVYAKLGVTNRAELAARLAAPASMSVSTSAAA